MKIILDSENSYPTTITVKRKRNKIIVNRIKYTD